MLGEHHGQYGAKKHVAYSDMDRMHGERRKSRCDRWLPPWSQDDRKVRLVIYNYLWNYVKYTDNGQLRPGMPLSKLERLAIGAMAKHAIVDERHKQRMDEHTQQTQNGVAARYTRVLYLAYRMRYKATDIAEILEVRPGTIRQILCRLNEHARKLFPESEQQPHHKTAKPRPAKRFKSPPVCPDLLKALAERYNQGGVTMKQLALDNGISRHSVEYFFHKFNLIQRPRKQAIGPRKQHYIKLMPRIEELAKRYNRGETLNSLAAQIGVNPASLYYFLKLGGLIAPNRQPRTYRKFVITPEIQELAFWRSQGVRVVDLACVSGISQRRLWNIFHRMGLPNERSNNNIQNSRS